LKKNNQPAASFPKNVYSTTKIIEAIKYAGCFTAHKKLKIQKIYACFYLTNTEAPFLE